MEFETVKDFITFCDEARKNIEGNKINVANLDRFYAVAEVAKSLFKDARVAVERPENCKSTTNIIIYDDCVDFEGEQKEKLIKILATVDGVNLSGCKKQDEQDGKFMLILTVEDIWQEIEE